MKFTKLIMPLIMAFLTTACVAEPYHTSVETRDVRVNVDGTRQRAIYKSDYPSYHCPPGHAKKGWC